MQNSADFENYCHALALRGHSRDWIRRNRPLLEERFARDTVPFEAPRRLPPSLTTATANCDRDSSLT